MAGSDKTYKTFVTSKNSDHLVQPPNMAGVFVYPSLDSLEAIEDASDRRKNLSDGVLT